MIIVLVPFSSLGHDTQYPQDKGERVYFGSESVAAVVHCWLAPKQGSMADRHGGGRLLMARWPAGSRESKQEPGEEI